MHYLALGVPGQALPTDLLTNCGLPTVDDMVFDSRHGERLFKDERDHTFSGLATGGGGTPGWFWAPACGVAVGLHASACTLSAAGLHCASLEYARRPVVQPCRP